ncbi:MAG: PepSY-like domain-containing protein [Bacteroidales bacterium]|nr:PepSY-like domain-containing protein [Bacteroidales bacterium]
MKKLFVFLISLFIVFPSFADNDVVIEKKDLPANAQQFIEKYFAGVEISYAKKEVEVFIIKSYDVILTNGVKLEFDSKGEWKDVDCKKSEVPSDIIPTPIRNYVKAKFPSNYIVEINKGTFGYDVDLNNGLELEFNKEGKFKSIDD